ncbi:NADH dehydrogenase (ubiquinone) 1 alpha subcomplex assembly factor 6 [uncultured Gammaproteobacteria bacterium]
MTNRPTPQPAAPAATPPADTLSWCAREVRSHDSDRFMVCLLAPPPLREALFALHAFNHEIARTREVVSEALLGQIRLQWWRQTVGVIFELNGGGGDPNALGHHEVIVPLAAAIANHRLSRAGFERLLDAREDDLDAAGPETLDALIAYARESTGALVQLALEVLAVRDEPTRAAGEAVGTAWSLTGLLRAVPFHAHQRRLYLPQRLMAQHGVESAQVFAGTRAPGLAAVVREIADTARAQLSQARSLRHAVPQAATPVLALATLADRYLNRLDRAGYDPFHPALHSPLPFRLPHLLWRTFGHRW